MTKVDGKVTSGPDLSVTHHSGLKLPNPFVIGSGMRQGLSLKAQLFGASMVLKGCWWWSRAARHQLCSHEESL